jgi:hypothetical protein
VSRPLVADKRLALMLGVAFYVAGSVLLWDAYEARGSGRPFWTKFLPG